jgi:hypothetical protein
LILPKKIEERTNKSECKWTGAKQGRDFGVKPDCRGADYHCKTNSDGITFVTK